MVETSQAPGLKTYSGNCHCGAVKFTFEAPEGPSVVECNCSICFKKAYKHLFPELGTLNIVRGEEHLKDYEFGGKNMLHRVSCFLIKKRETNMLIKYSFVLLVAHRSR